MSATTTPTPCVWWSATRCAWGCQIGNDRRYFYNEHDAKAWGEAIAGQAARSCSVIQVLA
jgi:hypothetical protein